MAKFVHNKSDAVILCRTKNGKKAITFKNATTDKMTGAVTFAGFTPISDDDLALLSDAEKGSVVFDRYSKRGMLVVVDSIPAEYQTVADQLSAVTGELASAKEEIEALKADLARALASDKAGEVKELTKENEALKARLSSVTEELTSVTSALEAAKAAEDSMAVEIVSLKEELEAVKTELESTQVELAKATTPVTDK